MTKHTMELVWHSCEDCPPEEPYNGELYVTDGEVVFPAIWKKETGFITSSGDWYIKPTVNARGLWWADLVQTVNGFGPIQCPYRNIV